MRPTIENGDVVFGERLSVVRDNLHRGDIVCSKSPYQPREMIVKRMAAKPFDEVKFSPASDLFGEFWPHNIVPKGHCFLLGDNTEASNDSREYGYVPLGLMQYRIVFRLWPLKTFGTLSTHSCFEPEESRE